MLESRGTGALESLRRFGDGRAMVAIRQTLPWSFIGLVVGGLAVFWLHPGRIQARVLPALSAGFGVMSAVLLVMLGVVLARRYAIPAAVLVPASIAAFAFSLPRQAHFAILDLATQVGATGILLAITVNLCATGLCVLGRKWFGARAGAFAGAVALIAISALLWSLHISLAVGLKALIAPLATLGDSPLGFVLVTFIETALWTAGIHGPALLAGVVTPVYLSLQAENSSAHGLGLPMPHIVTVSTFLFVFPGGAGATLSLVLLLLRSRVPRLRKIGVATLLPAIFNVNEPLMFGLPVVFNPAFIIPYVLVPTVTAVTTYLAIAHNLVSRPVTWVPSTIPVLLAVFLATLDWRAVILVLVNLTIGIAIYAPFVRAYERTEAARAAGQP